MATLQLNIECIIDEEQAERVMNLLRMAQDSNMNIEDEDVDELLSMVYKHRRGFFINNAEVSHDVSRSAITGMSPDHDIVYKVDIR